MANPQLEDGHTQIANEILEALMRIYLPPNQWQVLICIIRKTYGYKKKIDWIANSQIAEATGLVRSTVSRCLKALEQQRFIIRKKKSVGFQKDWEKWEVSSPANFEREISSPANNEELAALLSKISNPANKKLAALLPTKENKNKLIQKKGYGEFNNVLLTDKEHQKLKERLGARLEFYIESLSGYLEQHKRKHYDSHYATILNWYRREQKEKDGKARNTRELPKAYSDSPDYPDLR